MQSTDVPAVDLDRSDTKLNGNIVSEDVAEPKTLSLPELSNDIVKSSGEGLEVEEEDVEDMEVDFAQSSGPRADNLVLGNGAEDNDFEAVLRPSETPIVCVSEDGKRCDTSDQVVEDGSNQGSLGKTSFNSSAQHLFPKTVNEGIVDKEVVVDDVAEGGSTRCKEELQNEALLASDKVVVDLVSSVVNDGDKSKRKGGFSTSDLVWGKVRSHPWWPAQIVDIEDASEQAKKHFKSKGYLLAYFGDQTFAWNDKAKLKPFEPHFSQMAKQTNAEAFQDAVNCALDECARRAEFGLSCHCIADDVYDRLKIQVINNAGIRDKLIIREGRDRLYTPLTLEPVKFLDYVHKLAQAPHVEDSDRLDHVVAHAQMSAFYRWKGCYHLAEFGPLIGYVNNEADAPVSREKEDVSIQDNMEDEIRPRKKKKLSGASRDSTKKVKGSSESMRKKGKKDANEEDDELKAKESGVQITPQRGSKSGLRVGESILRAALQLSQPSPLLKLAKDNGKSKQRRKQTEMTRCEKSSPDAILSKFLLAAVDPLKEYSFLSSVISFFSDFILFRDSRVEDIALLQKPEIPSGSESEEMGEGSSSGSESTKETPTALTLKFTDMDSIPTEDKLNKIFGAFGPLKESETEVLGKKNCARVVFKTRVDAETAFSSSGKFETFGTSLVCYQLNYAPSPRKSASPEAKRRRKDGTLEEGIAA